LSEIIGIDLGTTFSAAAQVRDGVPRILPHGEERIMPSVVGVSPQGTMLVGTPARNQYLLYPERTVRSIKRRMGQEASVSLGERSYTPEEISAIILRELKRSAEAQLGRPVERAVITVPAYFSDAARQATRTAGELAGFAVERIINEPTAAALAYGLDRGDAHQMVAVYDLGGGTFDVSIVELDAGVVEVRASHGNTQLGGDDFDQALVDFLAERFQREHGVDPRTDRRSLARLTRAAEAAKITLSSEPFARVREEYLLTEGGRPLHLDVEVSRSEFEGLIENLLEGTLQSLDAALQDAGITARDLSCILFVGGSTRIPLVYEMVCAHTGIAPETAINPDEAVALGAAVQAAIIAGEPLEAILVDVTPHSSRATRPSPRCARRCIRPSPPPRRPFSSKSTRESTMSPRATRFWASSCSTTSALRWPASRRALRSSSTATSTASCTSRPSTVAAGNRRGPPSRRHARTSVPPRSPAPAPSWRRSRGRTGTRRLSTTNRNWRRQRRPRPFPVGQG
jgi:molecular chaperone DnaK